MTDDLSERRRHVTRQLFIEPTRREKMAWAVAGGAILVAIMGVGTTIAVLPLKETQAFLTIVDRDTGIAERTVEVQRANVNHADAVKQSLLYSYVVNRETYDTNDNEGRMLRVFRQSAGEAKQSLRDLWTGTNPNYPLKLYGSTAKVKIEILSINPIDDNTAQVRFVKTLVRPNEPDRLGNFTATVTYEFLPSQETALKLVWENPFGFMVTGYRVNSDSLEAQQNGK